MDGDELFFHEDLSIIHDGPLELISTTLFMQIAPKGDKETYRGDSFQFCMEMPDGSNPNYEKMIAIRFDLVLPDALCVRFYDCGIDVDGYDRESIMRRHTIKNIIGDAYQGSI